MSTAAKSASRKNPPRYIQLSNSPALRKNHATPTTPTIAITSSRSGAPFAVSRVRRHGVQMIASAAPINIVDARVSVPK